MTVVELMVVVAVASIILGLTLSVYSHAVRLSRQTACLNNLRQLAVALNAYYLKYRALPPDDDPAQFDDYLRPFIGDESVFHCPADPNRSTSSYAPYYVCRREFNSRDFIIGCPRHARGKVATVLFGSAGAEGNRLGEITHNGREVNVGDRVTGGMLRFADGSVASLQDGLSVDIVTSFRRSDGSYYTILRVPVGQEGAIGLMVNPRSRFEVVTPAAIAGSEGTIFYVVASQDGRLRRTLVYVKKGRVRVIARGEAAEERLLDPNGAVLAEFPAGTVSSTAPPSEKELPYLPGSKHYGKPVDRE